MSIEEYQTRRNILSAPKPKKVKWSRKPITDLVKPISELKREAERREQGINKPCSVWVKRGDGYVFLKSYANEKIASERARSITGAVASFTKPQ